MSWWFRLANVFRQQRLNQEIDEEFAAHLEEAADHGRDPVEARRAFGSRCGSARLRAMSKSSHGWILCAPT